MPDLNPDVINKRCNSSCGEDLFSFCDRDQDLKDWSETEKATLALYISYASSGWNLTSRIDRGHFAGFSPLLMVTRAQYDLLSDQPTDDRANLSLAYDIADSIYFQSECSEIASQFVPVVGKHLGEYAELMVSALLQKHKLDMADFRRKRSDLVRFVFRELESAKGHEKRISVITEAATKDSREDLVDVINHEKAYMVQIIDQIDDTYHSNKDYADLLAAATKPDPAFLLPKGEPIALKTFWDELEKCRACLGTDTSGRYIGDVQTLASVKPWVDAFGDAKSTAEKHWNIDRGEDSAGYPREPLHCSQNLWVFEDNHIRVEVYRLIRNDFKQYPLTTISLCRIYPRDGYYFAFGCNDMHRYPGNGYADVYHIHAVLPDTKLVPDGATSVASSKLDALLMPNTAKGMMAVNWFFVPFEADPLIISAKKIFNEQLGRYEDAKIVSGLIAKADLSSKLKRERVKSVTAVIPLGQLDIVMQSIE